MRGSRPEVFCKKSVFNCSVVNFAKFLRPYFLQNSRKGVLKHFTKFTGKRQCKSFLFNKVAGHTSIFIKKETLAQAFSCEFSEIFKNLFQIEYFWWLLVTTETILSINFTGYENALSWRKKGIFYEQYLQWQLLALLSLLSLLAFYTKHIAVCWQ